MLNYYLHEQPVLCHENIEHRENTIIRYHFYSSMLIGSNTSNSSHVRQLLALWRMEGRKEGRPSSYCAV